MPEAKPKTDVAGTARILVVLLAFAWGFNWIAAALALREMSPWSFRFAGAGIGAALLFATAWLTGHDLHVPRGERLHVMVAGFFNVAAFQILSAFAQLNGATSRAIVITYSMPIWATLLSWLMLRERLDGIRLLAFALCVAGITILIWPLFSNGLPSFVFYSLGCALGWAFPTAPRHMHCAIPSRRICWVAAATCVPFRNCWAMPACPPRRFIPAWIRSVCWKSMTRRIREPDPGTFHIAEDRLYSLYEKAATCSSMRRLRRVRHRPR